ALDRDLDAAVTLLRINAAADDGPRIAAQLHPLLDSHDQHAVVSSLVHLLEDNRDVREPLLALYVYEHSPCMDCRAKATRWLRDTNACPTWLLEEGDRDASEQVREICTDKSAPPKHSSMP